MYDRERIKLLRDNATIVLAACDLAEDNHTQRRSGQGE